MATNGDEEDLRRDIERRPQDDYVARRRPSPSDAASRGLTLSGVLGDSDRVGFRRLYVSRDLNRYVEFATADVVDIADIPLDVPPFIGEAATAITLQPGARVDFTRTHVADELDIEFRPGRPQSPGVYGLDWPPRWGSYRYVCVTGREICLSEYLCDPL
jgi:hypothetical protein